MESNPTGNPADELGTTEFDARVEANQRRLAAELQPSYDFIVCGSGSSGSVVARRLAESGRASVLLLEAGGTDDVPSVREARQWLTNFGTERHWNFQAEPNPLLNGRRLPLNMGKVLGGSSSINGMIWSRGHKNDWIISLTKRVIPPGAMNPSSASTVALRTGREPPTRSGVAKAAWSMWNRRAVPIRWPRRCSRLPDFWAFLPSTTRTVK